LLGGRVAVAEDVPPDFSSGALEHVDGTTAVADPVVIEPIGRDRAVGEKVAHALVARFEDEPEPAVGYLLVVAQAVIEASPVVG
jgi:hypothetical protein